MKLLLQKKVAIVTGGSTGIGRATAIDMAKEGASVVVADVNENEARETVKQIRAAGGEAVFISCNVADEASIKNMVAETVKQYGGLHIAFNNAGIAGAQGPVADQTLDNWNSVIGVNLTGVFLCMKYEIPEMLKSGGGSIINCASILGSVAFAGAAAYTASKHGVSGLTKVAALEYATAGIRVNAVGPGFVVTPMLQNAGMLDNPDVRKMVESLHPVNRLGQPEEIASLVSFLASDKASFITGQLILDDGGYTAR